MKMYLKSFAILIMVLISGCSFDEPTPAPSDNELITIFNENREIFDKLCAAINEDDYFVVSYNPQWSDPENIPLGKKKQYYDLLKKINARQVSKIGESIRINVWIIGWAGGGDSKGYMFKPKGADQLVDSLDNFSRPGHAVSLRRDIGDEWYLFYYYSP